MGITDKSRQQAQQKILDRQERKNKIKQQEQVNTKKSSKQPTEQQLEQIEQAKELFEESGLTEHWEYYQKLSQKYYGQ